MKYKNKQIEMVFRQLPIAYMADIVTGVTLCALLLYMGSGIEVYIWYGVLFVVTSVRMLLLKRLESNNYKPRQKKSFLMTSSLIGGSIWGLSCLMILENPSFLQVAVVGLWIAGMIAGAATTLSVIKPLFFAFSAPASILFIVFLSIFTDENTLLYLGAYAMYLSFMVPLALRISNDLNRGIKLQIINAKLQMKLREDSLRLKEREDELLIREKLGSNLIKDQPSMANVDGDLSILDSVNEGIYGINSSGKISFINSSALELLGFSEKEVIGQNSYKLINRYDNSLGEESRSNLAIIGAFRDGDNLQNVDSVFYGKGDSPLPVRFSCKPVKKGLRVIGTVVSFSDLTKQREMESMLIQAQKMEAIGRLTGGIAHDFNNLLTVIIGNLHFLQKRLASDAKATDLLNKIMNAANSGAELSNRLLSFSREQALTKEPLDIVEMLYEMREFIGRILGEEVSLEVRHQGKQCIAMTDRNQLESAIFNLCINARDAMPGGGKLTIIVRSGRATDKLGLAANIRAKENYVVLSIADTGTGIPRDIQKNIFDPFFTTKEKHRGTGLGLSSVYGFVKQSGGNIMVNSEPGVGSIFTLFIPSADQGVLPKKAEKPNYSHPPKHEGTILVVEDDDNVRDVANQMLIEAGFSVISAHDGPTGLQKFESHSNEIDLLFSDVIMPGGMNGIDLSKRILEQKPKLPIVLATGHTENVLKDSMKDSKNILFIGKPYDTNELPNLIHSLIEKSSQNGFDNNSKQHLH